MINPFAGGCILFLLFQSCSRQRLSGLALPFLWMIFNGTTNPGILLATATTSNDVGKLWSSAAEFN